MKTAVTCKYCASEGPCFDGRSMAGYPCQYPSLASRQSQIRHRIEWLQKLQALIASAEEAERVLTFAFKEGALPDETVKGLCIDPYGLLRDLRLSIQGMKS